VRTRLGCVGKDARFATLLSRATVFLPRSGLVQR
jgi:hypothetical protein